MEPIAEFWDHEFDPLTRRCVHCGEHVADVNRVLASCREPVYMAPAETEVPQLFA